MSELTAVSLFAGVEGIGLALHRAGVQVVAAVEKDDAARGVIADQFPDTHLFTDVTEVTADELRGAGFVPERGIITAGWPCQGNSVAGGRKGLSDPRSGLWRHVVRLLAELRPRWFLGENVPGLLSVTDGEDFGRVLQDVADLGYGFAYRVLDAQHFGVPQRRRRVFIVGCLGDPARPVQVLLEPEGSGRDSAPSEQAGTRIAATLTAGTSRPGISAPGRRQEDDHNLVVSALTANGVGTCGADDNQGQAGHLIVGALQTETTVRRLTPRECERLQGFPDDWTATSWGEPQADSPRYRQMGNAVAVPCVEWIARRIVQSEAADRDERCRDGWWAS
jgi:DNA (cytosine-5)-methyltransferase 1